MADRDAFGREKTENTLEGLGWSAGGPITPPGPAPAAPATPRAVPPASGAPPSTPTRQTFSGSAPTPVTPSWQPSGSSFGGGLPRIIIMVVVFGSIAAFVVPAIFTARTAVHAFRSISIPKFSTSVPTVPSPTTPVTPSKAAGSLLRPAAFARALGSIQRGHYGRLRLLRVAADRIDAQTVTRGGRLRSVQVPAGGRASVLSTSPPGFPQGNVLSLAAIDRRAPLRLALGAKRRTGSAMDYAATTSLGAGVTWTVMAKSGAQFLADAHGRITRRIN